MSVERSDRILCLTTYEKGQAFMRQCAAMGCRVVLLTTDKHKNGDWPWDILEEARKTGDFTRIAAIEKALAFNVSGHVLHSLFWKNLSPDGGDQPQGELADAIKRDFGSFDSFKKQLTQAPTTWDELLDGTYKNKLQYSTPGVAGDGTAVLIKAIHDFGGKDRGIPAPPKCDND